MFSVIFFIFIGIALGRFVCRSKQKTCDALLSRALTGFIWLLLFLLGVEVGCNERLLASLPTLGVEALLVGVLSALGSCVAAFFFWHRFCKSGDSE